MQFASSSRLRQFAAPRDATQGAAPSHSNWLNKPLASKRRADTIFPGAANMVDLPKLVTSIKTHLKGVDQSKIFNPGDKKKLDAALKPVLVDLDSRIKIETALAGIVASYKTARTNFDKQQSELRKREGDLDKNRDVIKGKIHELNTRNQVPLVYTALDVINTFRKAGVSDRNLSLLYLDLNALIQIPQTALTVE
jgi:hypothetical protein